MVVAEYGRGSTASDREVARLLDACGAELRYNDHITVPLLVLPRARGAVFHVQSTLRAGVRRFALLHEVSHLLSGDIDEPVFVDDPYPEFERRADLFAALGILSAKDRQGDADWIELRLMAAVPRDYIAWTKYRAPWIARTLGEVAG